MGVSLGALSGEGVQVLGHSCQVVHGCDQIVWDQPVFSSTDQTLAGEGFHQGDFGEGFHQMLLEEASGCCGLGTDPGRAAGIAVAAVAEAARIVLLWNKLV